MVGLGEEAQSSRRRSHQQEGNKQLRGLVPSVNEAFQYSPFTSILPFDSDLIPAPSAIPTGGSISVLQPDEARSIRQTFDTLDHEATLPGSTSALLSRTLGEVRHLLDGIDDTKYQFKIPTFPHNTSYDIAHTQHQRTSDTSYTTPSSRLAPFAGMVLAATDVQFRYVKPVSNNRGETTNGWSSEHTHSTAVNGVGGIDQASNHSGSGHNGHPHEHLGKTQQMYAALTARGQIAQEYNKRRFDQSRGNEGAKPFRNETSPVQPVVVLTPSSRTPQMTPPKHITSSHIYTPQRENPALLQAQQNGGLTPTSAGPAVFVPPLPSSSDPSQYQQYPDIDAQIIENHQNGPKKRKRDAEGTVIETDHQAQANVSVEVLKNLLADLFDAEDKLEPDTSGVSADCATDCFVPASLAEGRQPALTNTTLTAVEDSIAKVVTSHRFAEIAIEQVAHLQRLCHSSISLALGLDLSPPDGASDDAVNGWIERTNLAENGLRASKLLLKTMTAGRDEKQLYSEDVLQELLAHLQTVLESCITPLVEKRNSSSEGELFKEKPECQTLVLGLMQRAGRVTKLLGDLVLLTELSETSITTIEFLATKLLFLENASTDKESLLGIQKVEILRRHAMDVVAKIFLQCPGQRKFIFDEVLSSLEKLPVTRQSARQFKIATAKPIQLVSALIMQLVQTSTMSTTSAKSEEKTAARDSDGEGSPESTSDEGTPIPKYRKRKSEMRSNTSEEGPLVGLSDLSKPLLDTAQANAAYVMRYLVQRAMSSTKTGDQPYRNLLDIFTEDFLNVVPLPAWPAAEVLLRALLSQLFGIIDNKNAAAPAKNMALDLMGSVGSTIADLRSHVNHVMDTAENAAESAIPNLPKLCQDALEGVSSEALLGLRGPYRTVLEHMSGRQSPDLQSRSASCYNLANWAQRLINYQPEAMDTTVTWLSKTLAAPVETLLDSDMAATTESAVRLCYTLTLLILPMFKAFTRLLNTLLTCLTSPQATLRSRSLKSVIQLLEKDPSILDLSPTVFAQILHCTQDISPLVRDSALSLVGKCMTLRPSLGPRACKSFIEKSADMATGVRKRAVKLLGEAYLREKIVDVKAAIADAILARLTDVEVTIGDLARQTIEDIWLAPFRPVPGSSNLPLHTSKELEEHTSLIVATGKRGNEVMAVLVTLFKAACLSSSKASSANRAVCKAIVNVLFDCIIDNDQTRGRSWQKDCVKTLTIFAKADARLFAADQMTTLLPYIKNLATSDDLPVYGSVVMIYRRVLPAFPPLQSSFLQEVQDVILRSVQKLGKNELAEAAMCLWLITGVLQNKEKLGKLTLSVLRGIDTAKSKDISSVQEIQRTVRYLMLAGSFGKACDFEDQKKTFDQAFPSVKFESVSALIIDIVLPLTGPNFQLEVRQNALEAISLVCQSWPKGYQKSSLAFQMAFEDSRSVLEKVVLSGVKDFYLEEEARSKDDFEPLAPSDGNSSKERLGNSMVLSDKDGASTGIAQQFLPHIMKIALGRLDETAVMATDIITSINRQGLVHPKEIVAALVALETSPMTQISKIAFEEHRDVHAKHESMLDKEYLNAIEHAFTYQRDTIGSIAGVSANNVPKLGAFFDVMKTGSITSRKRFFGGLCTRLEGDLAKMATGGGAEQLHFARFMLENVGLFDYSRTDELLQLIGSLEKLFNTTGSTVAQHMEPLLAQITQAASENSQIDQAQVSLPGPSPDVSRLLLLTRSAMVLSMLWETRTHLRKAWGLQSSRAAKSKPAGKDASKPPVRSAAATPEDFLAKVSSIMAATEHHASMFTQCQTFLELINVDAEYKGTSDEDMEDGFVDGRLATPSENGTEGSGSRGSMAPPSSQGGRKKRLSLSAASTPQKSKTRGRPPGVKNRRSSKNNFKNADDDGGWD